MQINVNAQDKVFAVSAWLTSVRYTSRSPKKNWYYAGMTKAELGGQGQL